MKHVFRSIPFIFAIALAIHAQTPSPTLVLENEFLKLIVNNDVQDTGRFAIETTQGDPLNPLDDNQSLIYGRPVPWTSYTTLLIDNTEYVFGGPSKKMSRRTGKEFQIGDKIAQVRNDNAILTDYRMGPVSVQQRLSFFRTPSTRVKDSVLIDYKITNRSDTAVTVGLRLMLDTKLGSNDGAPFRIGTRAITSEIRVPKSELFPYWQTFDNLTTPTVIAQGTLESPEDGLVPPDTIILANWGSLADNPWNVDYTEGRSFIRTGEEEKDTALGMYWEPIQLAPHQTTHIRTVYGLGGLTVAPGDLSLGMSSPVEATIGARRELLIMGYVTNTGGFDSYDTVVDFSFPRGMVPTKGDTRFKLGQLKVGETRQIPLKVIVKQGDPGPSPIILHVTSSTLAPNQLQRLINLSAPGAADARVVLPALVNTRSQRYVTASVVVSNPGHLPLENVAVTLIASKGTSWFEVPTKSIASLAAGRTSTINWVIGPLSDDIASLDIKTVVTSFGLNPKTIEKKMSLEQDIPTLKGSLSHTSLKVGDYGYITIASTRPGAPVSGDVQIEGSSINPTRLTPDAWVTTKFQATSTQLPIPTIDVPKDRSGSIVRWHFKAIAPGTSQVIIQSGAQSQSYSIIVIP
jgi:hypothetical protein